MAEENAQHIDFTSIREILTVVFKHKYLICVVFAVVLCVALILASRIRPVYEAKSVLLIKLGREFYNRPEGASGGSSVPFDSIVRGEMSILTSRDLADKVVMAVGPRTLYPELAGIPEAAQKRAAVSNLSNDLLAAPLGGNLIEVRLINRNAGVAARAVNTLVDAFKDRHLEVFGGKSTEFLESQKKVFEERLRESENKLAAFKERNGIYSGTEQKGALIAQRVGLETAVREAQSRVAELEQNLSLVRSSNWVVEVPAEVKGELANLKQRERDLLERHTENSKTVQNVRAQIQEVEESLKRDSNGLKQKDIAKAESDLRVARTRADSLKRQLAQIDGQVAFLENRSVQLLDLNRDVAQAEQNYQTYARKLEESLISDDMDRRKMVAISVIEKATPPAGPRKKRLGPREMVAAGVVGGLGAGIALALLLEFMAPGMTTPLTAQRRLHLPVLVAIGKKG